MALLEYLKSTPLPLPESATSTPRAGRVQPGTVTPSFKRGELFLTNAHGKSFRLAWNGDEAEQQRALALPPGEYSLSTYRIVREQDGELWHISATRPAMTKVQVRAGNNTRVQINESIKLHSSFRGTHATMSIKGDNGAGLSIYRQEHRIPIGYRVRSESGEVIASGKMRYG
ncbi:MAG: hypothetical protein ACI8TQ_003739 [Planctomycetota bacterium]